MVAVGALVAGCTGDREAPAPQRAVTSVGQQQPTGDQVCETSVEGVVEGTRVHLTRAAFDGELTVSEGEPWTQSPGLVLFLFRDDRSPPEGESFVVAPADHGTGPKPHVYMTWRDPDTGRVQQSMVADDYELRLSFGQASGEQLGGEIFFSTASRGTELTGEFCASLTRR